MDHARLFTFLKLAERALECFRALASEPLSLRQHVGNRKTTGPAHSGVANPTSGAMDAGKTGTAGADQRLVSFDDRARRSRSSREDLGGPGRCFGCSSVGALFGNRQETEQPARLAAATLGFRSKPAPELSGR